MSAEEEISTINYYARRGYYHHITTLCENSLKKRLQDPTLQYWRAFGLIMEGKPTEGIRELQSLMDKRDLSIAVPLTLIHGHERCKLVDREAIDELHAKMTILQSEVNMTDRAYILAALFCWHASKLSDARAYAKKALEMNSNSGQALAILGWLDLTSDNANVAIKSHAFFDKAIERNARDLEALMGRLEYCRTQRRQFAQALDVTSQIIVFYPNFIPSYIERVSIFVETSAWDQSLEASQRVLNFQPDHVDALMTISLTELVKQTQGTSKTVALYLHNIRKAIERIEPTNAMLYYKVAAPFARLCNRHTQILDQCDALVQAASKLDPNNAKYKAELGYIELLRGDVDKAKSYYQAAISLDAQNVTAVYGSIKCQILNQQYSDAEEQLEFLRELQTTMKKSADISYLMSLVQWYKYGNFEKRLKFLREAMEMQLEVFNQGKMGFEFFVQVNPDFLLEIVKDYMDHCPTQPLDASQNIVHPILKTVDELLNVILKIVPGHTEALYYYGKTLYLMGNSFQGQRKIAKLLEIEPEHVRSHILLAAIYLESKPPNTKLATSSLDAALSFNFDVRHSPVFHILRARVLKSQEEYRNAIESLKTAMGLPHFKEAMNQKNNKKSAPTSGSNDVFSPSLADRVTCYLEMADCLGKLKQFHEATKAMQDAIMAFSGTSEEDRVTIANASLALERGEVDAAIGILATIDSEKRYFVQAKHKMAEIYLKYKNDRKAYARCFSELVDKEPSVESCVLLGDAYMKILEPEKAIAVYQQGLDENPQNSRLVSKIGKAFIRVHDYKKALSYYEEALSNNSLAPNVANSLRYDLAELYKKLGRFEDALGLVLVAFDAHASTATPAPTPAIIKRIGSDIDINLESSIEVDIPQRSLEYYRKLSPGESMNALLLDIKLYILLAQVYAALQQHKKSVGAYMKAREFLLSLFTKDINSTELKQHKSTASNVCYELAQLYFYNLKDDDRAMEFYNEAIQYNETNKKANVALVKLYEKKNDLTAAQNQCSNMLKADSGSEDATIMMADILFRQGSYEGAILHFRQLLEKNPANYMAMACLAEMMRRCGMLEDVPSVFENAEKIDPRVTQHAGFHFCKGLYYRYTNQPNEALKEFNIGRRDAVWGEACLHNMIFIFLNPDNETLGGEVLDTITDSNPNFAPSSNDKADAELAASIAASKLLKELPQNPPSPKAQVLECYIMMAPKQKEQVERACHKLMELLEKEREYIPALLALAVGFMHLKQAPKARNQLKRIAKMDWDPDFGEEFERAWLLLADIYIQGGKYDLASELLKKVLVQNHSCPKAWEYMGFIMEKEASYKDAAEDYQRAFKLDRENNPNLGYKLGFNLMKAKQYVNAIDVCNKILAKYPDYPKIQKDILDKARANIKVPAS